MAVKKSIHCRHCDQPIRPCQCEARGGRVHWQNETAPLGLGDLHCPGEPHQRHEPLGG